jgi:hypothetical protein
MNHEVRSRLAQLYPEIGERYGGCEKKLAYATMTQALLVKERRERRAGIALQVYPCAYADHWHLSSQTPTAAQQARLRAVVQQQIHGAVAELDAGYRLRQALAREAEDLLRGIHGRGKRVRNLPPSARITQQLTQLYEAQRDDFIRLEDVLERLTDASLAFDQLLAFAQTCVAGDGHPSAVSDQAFAARCAELQAEAEAERQASAAAIQRALARLETQYHDSMQDAKGYLNAQYQLPSFGP